jgi:hypothetical protein
MRHVDDMPVLNKPRIVSVVPTPDYTDLNSGHGGKESLPSLVGCYCSLPGQVL